MKRNCQIRKILENHVSKDFLATALELGKALEEYDSDLINKYRIDLKNLSSLSIDTETLQEVIGLGNKIKNAPESLVPCHR